MRTSLFVCSAVVAATVIAETQTPALPASATNRVDEVDLAAEEDLGRVEVSSTAAGNDRKVTVVCEDAPLSEVLGQFRKTVKANIISHESTNLARRVSISLYDTPWRDALKAVLGTGGFALDERNGIYFVAEEEAASPIVRTRSFELNHAGAEDTAKLINESFGEKDPKTGKIITNVATVFKDANVVVVKGNDKLMRDCEEIIRSVDKAPAQVYIEARFIELSNAAKHDLGIKWDKLQEYNVSLKNVKYGVENNFGRLANYGYTTHDGTTYNDDTAADGTRTTTRSIAQSTSSLVPTEIPESISLLDAVGGTEQARSMQWAQAQSFSGQLSADDFNLALSAFEQLQDIKMFSNPRIIVSNGKKAEVDMTTKYPNVRVTSNRTGGISDSLDITAQLEQIPGEEGAMFAKEVFFSWGISLAVTPRISPDGLINVEIVPMISDLNSDTPWAAVNGSGSEDSVYSKYPVIDVQRLVTDFTMQDGSTAVIGGLTRTQETDVDSGIPYLRKIPWIGQKIFGWKSRQKEQREILVFVTVGIAKPQNMKKDVGLPKNAVLGREYVEGRALEPGDRGGVKQAMELDMRTIEERREDAEKSKAEAIAAEKAKVTVILSNPAPEASGPKKETASETDQQGSGPSKKFVPETAAPLTEEEKKLRHGRK